MSEQQEWDTNLLSRTLSLIHDPTFVAFEAEQEAPTIFRAVGRTYTETWHSALLGWLLNPASNHLLGTFPLMRMMVLAETQDLRAKEEHLVSIAEIAVRADFTGAIARPNESEPREVTVRALGGRFDVFVENIKLKGWSQVQLLIEMKVEASVNEQQCNRYANYATEQRASGTLIVPIYIAPQAQIVRHPKLFTDGAWIALDFQSLTSELIEPCLKHPRISDFGRSTLNEYLHTLKVRQNGGEPLAITERERELVMQLLHEHEPTLEAIFRVLYASTGRFEPSEARSTAREDITIQIAGATFQARSVPEVFRKVLEYLDAKGCLSKLELPISSGSKRYLNADEPVHPAGNQFIKDVEYNGYHMEGNKSRDEANRDVQRLFQLCNLTGK